MLPSEVDLSYAAGALDSDGYITVHRKLGKARLNGSRSYVYSPRIGLGQIDRTVPDWLRATFGVGQVYEIVKTRSGVRAFVWQTYSRDSASVARLVLPYLKLKRERAALVIELAEDLASGRIDEPNRERLFAAIRALQSRTYRPAPLDEFPSVGALTPA